MSSKGETRAPPSLAVGRAGATISEWAVVARTGAQVSDIDHGSFLASVSGTGASDGVASTRLAQLDYA
jgi:hypothetical protein